MAPNQSPKVDQNALLADCLCEQAQVTVRKRLRAARELLQKSASPMPAKSPIPRSVSLLEGLNAADLRVIWFSGAIAWSYGTGHLILEDEGSVDAYYAHFASLPPQALLEATQGLFSEANVDEFKAAIDAVDTLWEDIFRDAWHQLQVLR